MKVFSFEKSEKFFYIKSRIDDHVVNDNFAKILPDFQHFIHVIYPLKFTIPVLYLDLLHNFSLKQLQLSVRFELGDFAFPR